MKNFSLPSLLIGAALGALVAFITSKGMGANTHGITGSINTPYQAGIDRGSGRGARR